MNKYIWLAAIFGLGILLRVWNLASLPMGFTPDEAAFGYNAYSLLKTGYDEWGTPFYKLPVTNLESFGDYKLPLYAFLTVPSVAIFGLNEFASRLPNAIFGSVGVLVMFLFSFQAFKNFKFQISLIAAFLYAFSPWSIQLSRGAFEANLVTLLLPLFLALFLSKKYLLASLILALNYYSYHSARFLSLFLIPLFLYKSKSIIHNSLFIILMLPGFLALFGSGGARSADVSILSPTDNWQAVSDARFSAVQSGLPDPIARIFYNKATYVISQFTKNYATYFSPQFLFTEGPRETTYGMHPGTGVLYQIEALFLLAAVFYFIKYPNKSGIWYLVSGILLAAVPAALSKGPGYAANRAASMLPFLILLSSLGMSFISKYVNKKLLYFLITLSLINFIQLYVYHARDLAPGMLYGRKEALIRVANLAKDYDQIFVSRSLSEPHIYVAFYNQVDPVYYQKYSDTWRNYRKNYKFLDQYEGYTLGKHTFGSLKFKQTNSLYVGLPQDFPDSQQPMFKIDYPDGHPAVFVSRL